MHECVRMRERERERERECECVSVSVCSHFAHKSTTNINAENFEV